MRIFVLFVEPMLYIMDLIHEVYEQTEHTFQYVFCASGLTGKDGLTLPSNALLCGKGQKRTVVDCMRQFRPDMAVINGYTGAAQTAAIRYCIRHRIPYAIESDTPLHIPARRWKAAAKKVYLRSLLANDFCYGFPGGTLQRDNLVYYGIPKERCFIMPMSVSKERLTSACSEAPERSAIRKALFPEDRFIFLFVGRLAEEKNVGLLLEAYRALRAQRDDVALLIVGDGDQRRRLEAMAADTGDILFAGYQVFPHLVTYYKAADCLVLPSKHEPWGLVVNEAMSLGLPVIASSAVGCRVDLVRSGANGFVFATDDGASLLHAMRQMLEADAAALRKGAEERMAEWNHGAYLKAFKGAVSCIMT